MKKTIGRDFRAFHRYLYFKTLGFQPTKAEGIYLLKENCLAYTQQRLKLRLTKVQAFNLLKSLVYENIGDIGRYISDKGLVAIFRSPGFAGAYEFYVNSEEGEEFRSRDNGLYKMHTTPNWVANTKYILEYFLDKLTIHGF